MERSELKERQLVHNILVDKMETILGFSHENNYVVTKDDEDNLDVYSMEDALEDLEIYDDGRVEIENESQPTISEWKIKILSVDDKLKILGFARDIVNDIDPRKGVFDIAREIESYIKHG